MTDATIFTVYRAAPGRVVATVDRLLPIPPVGSGVSVEDDEGQEDYEVRSTVLNIHPATGDVTLDVNLR